MLHRLAAPVAARDAFAAEGADTCDTMTRGSGQTPAFPVCHQVWHLSCGWKGEEAAAPPLPLVRLAQASHLSLTLSWRRPGDTCPAPSPPADAVGPRGSCPACGTASEARLDPVGRPRSLGLLALRGLRPPTCGRAPEPCPRQRVGTATGTLEPAIALNRRLGFVGGSAFGDYVASDFNQFLYLDLPPV